MIRVSAIAIVLSLPIATSATALEDGWWCSESESMHVDAYGIGFNEHTICDVENLPVQMGADDRYTSAVACRNVYVIDAHGDEPQAIHEIPVDGFTQITLIGAPDGTLILTTDLHDEDIHFLPCN